MQVMTLYNSYDEYNIDMDILGKVVSIPQLSRDELKEVVFKELQETHPIPKLEDERYKLSRLVDEDYQIQVENYAKEFEDEDFSVDDLGGDEDPYTLGTDEEDLYSIGDVYGLDLNIFSSPFTEDEVNQAVSDIENFLSQKVKKFSQNKAEYEKRNELSVEEVRALFQKKASTGDGLGYTDVEDEDEEMIDTESSSEDMEMVYTEDEEMVYVESSSTEVEESFNPEGITQGTEDDTLRVHEQEFISEPEIPYIVVEPCFVSEPDVPYIQVETTKTIETQGTAFIDEPDIPYIVVEVSNKDAEFFVEEADIPFISVTNSGEVDAQDDVYVQESDELDAYQDEGYDTFEEDEDGSFDPEEDDSIESEDGDYYTEEGLTLDGEDEEEDGTFDVDEEEDADFSEGGSVLELEEGTDDEEDFSFDPDEAEEEESSYSISEEEEEEVEEEDGFFDSDDEDLVPEDEEVDDTFDSEEEDGNFVISEPEPVLSPPPQVKERIIESKGSDTLNPRQVSKGSDLEGSFIDKPLASDTKLTRKSTEGREITEVPRDLVDFLRLYPRTQYKVAVQYYTEKEVKRQIRMGRVYKNGKYLVI